jgi:hypothetical protein
MKRHHAAALVAFAIASGYATISHGQQAPSSAPAVMDESVPQVARDACLSEVRRTTNNPDLTIIEMLYSEANSQAKVGVGPDRAPWQCLVSNSGVVVEVMSITDEGAL